jgi:cyanate permease
MVNTIGMLGTTIGPVVVGWLKDYSGTFTSGLIFVSGSIVLGALCLLALPGAQKRDDISQIVPATP